MPKNGVKPIFDYIDSDYFSIIAKRNGWKDLLINQSIFDIPGRVVNDISNLILPIKFQNSNVKTEKELNKVFKLKIFNNLIKKTFYNTLSLGNCVVINDDDNLVMLDVYSFLPVYDCNGRILGLYGKYNVMINGGYKTKLIFIDSIKNISYELIKEEEYFEQISAGWNIEQMSKSKKPIKYYWFQTNIIDEEFINTPYTKSLFYHTGIIEEIENTYKLLKKDVRKSEKFIFVDKNNLHLIDRLNKGNTDSNTKDFFMVADVGANFMKDFNPQIRDANYFNIISKLLKTFGLQSGFGSDFYNIDQAGAGGSSATATEVKAKMNKQLLKNIWDLRALNEGVILDMVKEYCRDLTDIDETTIEWEEVQLTDDERMNIGCNLYKQGVLPLKRFYTDYYDVSESTAKKYIKELNEEKELMGQIQAGMKGKLVSADGGETKSVTPNDKIVPQKDVKSDAADVGGRGNKK